MKKLLPILLLVCSLANAQNAAYDTLKVKAVKARAAGTHVYFPDTLTLAIPLPQTSIYVLADSLLARYTKTEMTPLLGAKRDTNSTAGRLQDSLVNKWTKNETIDTTHTAAVSLIRSGYGITATKNAKDYTIKTDTSVIANKDYVNLAVASLELTEYLYTLASGGFYVMGDTAQNPIDSLTSASSASSPQNIFNFETRSGKPDLDRLVAGTYDVHLHASTSSVSGRTTALYWELWRQGTTASDSALIGTSTTSPNLTTAEAEYTIDLVLGTEIPLALTDRLKVKLYANHTGAATTVKILMGGTHDSHLSVRVQPSTLVNIFYQRSDTGSVLASKNFVSNQYQPKGTYLIPSDSTLLHNAIYARLDSTTSVARFQPLENQRLSTTNSPTFGGLTLSGSSFTTGSAYQTGGTRLYDGSIASANLRFVTQLDGAGADYFIYSYDDAGAYRATPLWINRSTSLVTLAGGLTLNGAETINQAGAHNYNYLNSASASYNAGWFFQNNGTPRWLIYKTNEAETGSDAGANLQIASYTDAGAYKAGVITINRATSTTTFAGPINAGTNSITAGAATLTVADGFGVNTRSGNAANWSGISVGRTANEFDFGVIASAGQFFGGTAAGDATIRLLDTSKKLKIGIGNATTPIVDLSSTLATINLPLSLGTNSLTAGAITASGEIATATISNARGLRMTGANSNFQVFDVASQSSVRFVNSSGGGGYEWRDPTNASNWFSLAPTTGAAAFASTVNAAKFGTATIPSNVQVYVDAPSSTTYQMVISNSEASGDKIALSAAAGLGLTIQDYNNAGFVMGRWSPAGNLSMAGTLATSGLTADSAFKTLGINARGLNLSGNASIGGTVNGFTLRQGSALSDTTKFALTSSLGTLATLNTINNSNWSGTALADGNIASASTWNTAYTDRLKWDGGSTGLIAATGRTSLGLGSMALADSATYHGSASINTLGKITSYNGVTTAGFGVPGITTLVNLTNQGSAIDSTQFDNIATAGLYRISYFFVTRTAQVTSCKLTLYLYYDGPTSSQFTATPSEMDLTITLATVQGANHGVFVLNLPSTRLKYRTVATTGSFNGGTYDLIMAIERLN